MRLQIGTLIVATSVIQLANGFFGTFISLRIAVENFGSALAGVVLSSYFAGFTLGALRCGGVIGRIGHIRAYAAFAGMAVAATAAMPLLVGPWAWTGLRAVVGIGYVGLFITTESWLSAKAQPAERGRVFAVYMVGTFPSHGDLERRGPPSTAASVAASRPPSADSPSLRRARHGANGRMAEPPRRRPAAGPPASRRP